MLYDNSVFIFLRNYQSLLPFNSPTSNVGGIWFLHILTNFLFSVLKKIMFILVGVK